MNLLLRHGASVGSTTAKKNGADTPLHLAVGRNQVDVVSALLESGALVDAR